jgi:hypothetical protein
MEAPRAEGLCLYNLSWAHFLNREYADACTAAREAVDAFRRCGGADVTAGEALAQAGAAMLANDAPAARAALAAAASASEGNCDLAPARWLTAEAERLGRAPSP